MGTTRQPSLTRLPEMMRRRWMLWRVAGLQRGGGKGLVRMMVIWLVVVVLVMVVLRGGWKRIGMMRRRSLTSTTNVGLVGGRWGGGKEPSYCVHDSKTPPNTQRLERFDVIDRLEKLERKLNAWNHSSAGIRTRILPLGQAGYVKRDLPVYKKAFDKSNELFELLPRPESGKLDSNLMDSFDVILCLSFNTDHCVSDEEFQQVVPARRINRIMGLRDVLWSKHEFCKTLTDATRDLKDSDLRSFYFQCWVLPEQYAEMIKRSKRLEVTRWIVKPRSLGAGMGIYVVDTFEELKRERFSTHVVQEYLQNPHLIPLQDGAMHKWDCRTYVLITSVFPLRAYVFNRGLVRFATAPYSTDCRSKNGTSCLTNTSINKKIQNDDGAEQKLKDITWSFKSLKDFVDQEGNNNNNHAGGSFDDMWLGLQRAIGLVLLSSEPAFHNIWQGSFQSNCRGCFQLVGIDVIFDSRGAARVIEVNGEPSMKLERKRNSHYDNTKTKMIEDAISLVFSRTSTASFASKALQNAFLRCGNPIKSVSKEDLQYVLDATREMTTMGGFTPVFPHRKLMPTYRRYLTQLGQSSRSTGNGDDDDDDDADFDIEKRLLFHDLIAEVLYPGSLAEESSSSNDDDDDDD